MLIIEVKSGQNIYFRIKPSSKSLKSDRIIYSELFMVYSLFTQRISSILSCLDKWSQLLDKENFWKYC